jgi:hypothetical protein
LEQPCPIPKVPGIYAWYFKEVPPGVPTTNCILHKEYTLLYIGISPKAPPKNGRRPSGQSVCSRLRYHFQGNAEGSTLRLSLGCLLRVSLNIQLRRVGSGNRLTFAQGEAVLSDWMDKNAFIAWCEHPSPWEPEEELIKEVSLPLNLDQNQLHPFYWKLKRIRQLAKVRARELPIVP